MTSTDADLASLLDKIKNEISSIITHLHQIKYKPAFITFGTAYGILMFS